MGPEAAMTLSEDISRRRFPVLYILAHQPRLRALRSLDSFSRFGRNLHLGFL